MHPNLKEDHLRHMSKALLHTQKIMRTQQHVDFDLPSSTFRSTTPRNLHSVGPYCNTRNSPAAWAHHTRAYEKIGQARDEKRSTSSQTGAVQPFQGTMRGFWERDKRRLHVKMATITRQDGAQAPLKMRPGCRDVSIHTSDERSYGCRFDGSK